MNCTGITYAGHFNVWLVNVSADRKTIFYKASYKCIWLQYLLTPIQLTEHTKHLLRAPAVIHLKTLIQHSELQGQLLS